MRKCLWRFVLPCVMLVLFLEFSLRAGLAVPEFEAEFKVLYYRPNHNAKAKAFADAVDRVSTEMPSPAGKRMAACNVCHMEGKHKRERNDYGKALDALLDRRADSKNKEKIQRALKQVSQAKKGDNGPMYFELIGQGQLPGEPLK